MLRILSLVTLYLCVVIVSLAILTVVPGGSLGRSLILCSIVITTASLVAGWFWFVVVPQNSLELAGGDMERQRRLLHRVISTPGSQGLKAVARYMLGASYQRDRHYHEAESLFRSLLSERRVILNAGFQSQIRQRLADTIEAQGRGEEAETERQRRRKYFRGPASPSSPIGPKPSCSRVSTSTPRRTRRMNGRSSSLPDER